MTGLTPRAHVFLFILSGWNCLIPKHSNEDVVDTFIEQGLCETDDEDDE